MEKIAIVGPPGAGKTTLTKELSSILKIKVFHLDRFFWQRDWKKETKDNRVDILQNLVREKQWIIEGNYFSSSDLHVLMADTIIFTELSSFVCFLRLIKRHYRDHARSRRDIPEGCTNKLTLDQVMKAQTFPFNERRMINRKLYAFRSKYIIRLRSSNEVDGFLAQLELMANKKRKAYRTVYAVKRSGSL